MLDGGETIPHRHKEVENSQKPIRLHEITSAMEGEEEGKDRKEMRVQGGGEAAEMK